MRLVHISISCIWLANIVLADTPDANTTIEKSREIRHDTIRAFFRPALAQMTPQTKLVDELIEQLTGMKFKSKNELIPQTIPVLPEVNLPANVSQKASLEKLSSETLAKLEVLAENPNIVSDPFPLAQMLFNCGQFTLAAKFYYLALDTNSSSGRALTIDDKAWILLQIAECNKNEPSQALKAIDRLLQKYPNSIWSRAAHVKRELLQWYAVENPETLTGVAP